MGEQRVTMLSDRRDMNRFIKMLLDDVEAMTYMLENDWIENDVVRIGAEQEMVLIERDSFKPAPIAMKAMDAMEHLDWVETELANFNLEINLDPQVFTGGCMAQLEQEIRAKLGTIRGHLGEMGADILLTGILPTLRKYDLGDHNLTPKKRYKALMEAIRLQNQGRPHQLRVMGIDEMLIKHNTPFIEACNTSFQVHLQVASEHFVQMYNIAQALAAPTLAIAANSPIVFGRRLWHETRIAMFQQALDTRASQEHMRERSARVSFGNDWIHDSILDIYKEDIARFKPILLADQKENSLDMIKKGQVPKLRALQVHNSTIYRWNRPCYGISPNGKPHLRIENRVFSSGPTVLDEMANAAFWLGAMKGFQIKYDDIRRHISFDEVKDNFAKAARYGIDTKFSWIGDTKFSAVELITKEILPAAKLGLEAMQVDSADIDRYMGVIEERVDKHMTGARWMLKTYSHLIDRMPRDEARVNLTAAIYHNQLSGRPVGQWSGVEDEKLIYKPSRLRVDEFMSTDLFTVAEDDLIDLVGDLMSWKKLRYVPVENDHNELIGLVTERMILKTLLRLRKSGSKKTIYVRDIMKTEVVTIDPEATIKDANQIMDQSTVGCLPVVRDGQLIGLITETDFLKISKRLMHRLDQ